MKLQERESSKRDAECTLTAASTHHVPCTGTLRCNSSSLAGGGDAYPVLSLLTTDLTSSSPRSRRRTPEGEPLAAPVAGMDITGVRSFLLSDTDVVFDSHFHPLKPGILAVATIEGHVHV